MPLDRWVELAIALLLGIAGLAIPRILSMGRMLAQLADHEKEIDKLRKWRHDVIAKVMTETQGDVAALQERVTVLEGHRPRGSDAE